MTRDPLRDQSDAPEQPQAALVDYDLTICGLDELPAHAGGGVTHVLSIIDPEAPLPAALTRFEALRQHWALRFHDISTPARDMTPPAQADVEQIIAVGRELARSASGGHVLVHCHAGVSRSTAATAILLARESPGREAEAFRTVARLRPGAWPNGRMIDLADALLARQGRLTAGLREMQEARMGGRPRSFWRF